MVFSHILQPISDLIRIASQQANTLSQKAPEEMQSEAEISWPNPIEINFIRKIIPNDVATITCQITSPSGKSIQVPEEWHAHACFSPNFSLSSENNFLQSKSLDDESEIQDFTSFPNHCEAEHFVSDLGLDSKSQCSAIKKK
ncbi:hypothetical protein F8M41_000709 [Gigaspora margarita]|uniref:Uncharacterized protein n=1 Tax=Gigaspora margarita TaxID=4874 RepID=A0A8H4A9M4_GIGMA|nr:hypothetical protein F8M41_000709 [Gigaspora margarita]